MRKVAFFHGLESLAHSEKNDAIDRKIRSRLNNLNKRETLQNEKIIYI